MWLSVAIQVKEWVVGRENSREILVRANARWVIGH